MGKIALPAGTQWAGLNKRVDPVEITPEQSPDCANVFFYDQTLGLLGPRLGKAYAGATNYNIWGVIPYNISGQIGSMVAYGDSTSTEINLLNLYSVTTPHAGWGDITLVAPDPAIPAVGFYHVQALSAAPGETTATSGAIAIPVNGATNVTCTVASLLGDTSATISIYGTFDGGVGRKLLSSMELSAIATETLTEYSLPGADINDYRADGTQVGAWVPVTSIPAGSGFLTGGSLGGAAGTLVGLRTSPFSADYGMVVVCRLELGDADGNVLVSVDLESSSFICDQTAHSTSTAEHLVSAFHPISWASAITQQRCVAVVSGLYGTQDPYGNTSISSDINILRIS